MVLGILGTITLLTGCFQQEGVDGSGDEQKQNGIEANSGEQLSMGSWQENVYTNDFLGLEFRMPDSWEHSSDTQIAQMVGISGDIVFGGEEFMQRVLELPSMYYVFASDPSTGNNLSIFTDRPSEAVAMEDYVNIVKNQLQGMTEIVYEVGNPSKEIVGGKEITTIEARASEYNMDQKYYIYQRGRYFVGMIATSATGKEVISDLMKGIKLYD